MRLLPASEGFASVSPVSIWPGALWFGIVPALAGALVLSATVGAVGLWCLAWAGVATLIAWQRWRHRGYLHDDEGLVSRSGLLGYRVDAFLFRKVQRVTVTQSPLERRNGLAGLRVDLASGQVSVPFIEHETARRLCNYILFKAESSQTPWLLTVCRSIRRRLRQGRIGNRIGPFNSSSRGWIQSIQRHSTGRVSRGSMSSCTANDSARG